VDTLVEGIPLVGGVIKGFISKALGNEVAKVVLSNGDAYCAWMYLNTQSSRLNRNYLSRLDFVDRGGAARCTGMGFCVNPQDRKRTSGTFTLRVYDNGAKVGEATKPCVNRTRCWSGKVAGTKSATAASTGFAGCLELKKKDGKIVSILVAQGKLPDKIKATQGEKMDGTTCSARLAH
jgi:hypothetical protein